MTPLSDLVAVAGNLRHRAKLHKKANARSAFGAVKGNEEWLLEKAHSRRSCLWQSSSLALVPSGCGARRKPNLGRIFAPVRVSTGKRPIIVVPGLLGTELVNQRTGEVVWPALRRCSDDELDLPVSPNLAANRDGLRPGNIIDKARFVRILPKVSFDMSCWICCEFTAATRKATGTIRRGWGSRHFLCIRL